MKKTNFSFLWKAAMILLFGASLITTACKKDDNNGGNEPIVLDGIYIKGGSTALTDLNTKGMMKVTRNEVVQQDRAQLFEIYVAVKKGDPGFNIVQVTGATRKTFGPGADFAKVTTPDNDEPREGFMVGSYAENNKAFTVEADGIYHVVIDTKLGKASIALVKYWGLIGAATPGGWSNDTKLLPGNFDLNTMSFEATNVTMSKGEFKYRYSGGWKIILDTTEVINPTYKGVKVNTNFGNKIDQLVPGGDNIVFNTPGIYTAKAVWTLGSGWVMTLTKTGDIPTIDYSNYEMGIIGNSYNKIDGNPAAWDENFGTHKPVVVGKIYTWTYNIDMFPGEFKFRQGDNWAGKSIGYGDCTWAGPAAADFSNAGGNIKIETTAKYTLVLSIDATTETYTVTATKR